MIKELEREIVHITSWAEVFHRKFEGDFLKTLSRLRSKFKDLKYTERIYSGAFSEIVIESVLEYDGRTQLKRSGQLGGRQLRNLAFEAVDVVGEEFRKLRNELLDDLITAGATKIAEITKDIHKKKVTPSLPSSSMKIPKVGLSDFHVDMDAERWQKELSLIAKEWSYLMAKQREEAIWGTASEVRGRNANLMMFEEASRLSTSDMAKMMGVPSSLMDYPETPKKINKKLLLLDK